MPLLVATSGSLALRHYSHEDLYDEVVRVFCGVLRCGSPLYNDGLRRNENGHACYFRHDLNGMCGLRAEIIEESGRRRQSRGQSGKSGSGGDVRRCQIQRRRFDPGDDERGLSVEIEAIRAGVSDASMQPMLESVLTCPACGFAKSEIMPTDACQYYYECSSCRTLLRPKPGDCCVYCSYGSVKRPPIQAQRSCRA